ncbi:fic family toxin-antitoxin system, toxin component [Streptomyces formicae]|uniref:Fic family toxin-antitoxin system, toxin component n=1 Tax=Streptomyces formicae TaxID=1616117 RepID=A0ABY3WX15_9ACTN|nr:fic family toxin-antitoxin system, toxin component [Streptomyces formicae]UNM15847.1 fic family toxin-antitoxin system, toxin component [Streptomyces formicae]
MTHHLDLSQLLWTAERLPGDPQADDYGSLIAAIDRAGAAAFGYEVYGSVPLKAAALFQTIALLKPLEHSNKTFAFAAARAFMRANGQVLRPKPDQLSELLANIQPGAPGVRAIAERLAQWVRPPGVQA